MKKSILSVVLAVIALSCYSQEKKETSKVEKQANVSEVVKSAFSKEFPKASKVKWSEEKTGEFEAEFILNKVEMSANFDAKGSLLETESEIKESELPQAIKSTLAKDFESYKIREVEKSDANGVIKYEMEAKKDGKEFELVFDNTGKLIKQEEEKEKKDND